MSYLDLKLFKPFGPSLGKGKLSKKFIKCINDKIDKSTVNKKNDYSSKLVSQIDNEIKTWFGKDRKIISYNI